MTKQEFKEQILNSIDKSFHPLPPLFLAIIDEQVDNVFDTDEELTDGQRRADYLYALDLATNALKGLLKGAIEAHNANQVTLTYRGETYVLDRNTKFLGHLFTQS